MNWCSGFLVLHYTPISCQKALLLAIPHEYFTNFHIVWGSMGDRVCGIFEGKDFEHFRTNLRLADIVSILWCIYISLTPLCLCVTYDLCHTASGRHRGDTFDVPICQSVPRCPSRSVQHHV